MISSGKVEVIPNIKDVVLSRKFDTAQTHVISDQFLWPNNVSVIPQDIFTPPVNALVVPDGFLPPGFTDGGIYILVTNPKDATIKQQ